jgi:hypothetical protein
LGIDRLEAGAGVNEIVIAGGFGANYLDALSGGLDSAGQTVSVSGGYIVDPIAHDPVVSLFDPEASVTLVVNEADDGGVAAPFDADGTVVLNTSLATLQELGIDRLAAAEGVNDIVVAGGFGTDNIDQLVQSGFGFDQDALVSLLLEANADQGLQLAAVESDDPDVTSTSVSDADGTVVLQTSLKDLEQLGIDRILAADDSPMSVVVKQGLGGASLEDLNVMLRELEEHGLDSLFADKLDVELLVDKAEGGQILDQGGIDQAELDDILNKDAVDTDKPGDADDLGDALHRLGVDRLSIDGVLYVYSNGDWDEDKPT